MLIRNGCLIRSIWVANRRQNGRPVPTGSITFKDVTAPTNARTMIASVIPRSAYGNTLPALMPIAATLEG